VGGFIIELLLGLEEDEDPSMPPPADPHPHGLLSMACRMLSSLALEFSPEAVDVVRNVFVVDDELFFFTSSLSLEGSSGMELYKIIYILIVRKILIVYSRRYNNTLSKILFNGRPTIENRIHIDLRNP
jgi:hypothetical protein